MEIYVHNLFDFHIFSFFQYDFIIYIDFTHIALQTQQLMTSQIRSYIEYLIRTYNILVLILQLKLVKKSSLVDDF